MPQQSWDEHGNPVPAAPAQQWDEKGNLITPPAAKASAAPSGPVPTERAMQQGIGGAPMFVDVPKGDKEKFEAAGKAGYATGGRIGMEMVGAAGGGELGLGAEGLAGVGLRALGTGVGTGVASVAGQAASTGKVDFWDAVKTGAVAGILEPLGEGATASMKRLSRLWKADPERFKNIGDIISTEEKTRQTVQDAAPQIRKAINETYPEVHTPVRIMPAAKVAQKAEAGMVAESAPGQVSRLADIGRGRQQQALRLLARARAVMESSPEGAGEEVAAILDKAKKLQGIDFKDAQKLYSALGRASAKGQGWKLSGEQIHALTDARDMLESSMHDALKADTDMAKAAKAIGIMPEGADADLFHFRDPQTGGSIAVKKTEYSDAVLAQKVMNLRKSIDTGQLSDVAQQKLGEVRQRFAQYQPPDKEAAWTAAQARHRQFVEDFYKTGGALKPIMDAEPNERGTVLKHLISDPTSRVRATEALKRYGIDTSDVMRLAEKWRDPTELNRIIQDAARAEQVGSQSFSKQEVAATRKKVGSYLTKGAVGLAGAEAMYQLYKALGPKAPNLLP